jgi:hypothetical protein
MGRRQPALGRYQAAAAATGLVLVGFVWGAWPTATPQAPEAPKSVPVVIAPVRKAPEPKPPVSVTVTTQPEGAEVFVADSLRGRSPLDLELQANSPVTLVARAPGHAEARVEWTPTASGGPVRLELKPLVHVLHVETDPPGAWIVIAGKRAISPADIELPNFSDKRVGVTAGRYGYLDGAVYVPASEFIERDGALRANVKLKLKYDRKPAAPDQAAEKPATNAVAPAAPTK